MKLKNVIYMLGLLSAGQVQAGPVFVYEPDWEKLATTIVTNDSLSSIAKDPAVSESIKKAASSEDFQKRVQQIDTFIKSPEGQKLVQDLKANKDLITDQIQHRVSDELRDRLGANCSAQSCVFTDFSMQIGSRTLKADTYEVPIVDGKIDLRRGTGTNTVLVDPKSGDMKLGTSTINANKLQDGFQLSIGASELNHHQKDSQGRDKSILSIPDGVQIQAVIDQSSGKDQFQIEVKSNSGVTYRQTPNSDETTTFQSSSSLKLSVEYNGSSDKNKLYLGTDDPNSTISLRKEKGNSVLDAKLSGETYFLAEGDQRLLVSKQVSVDDKKSQGVVDNLEIRSNGSNLNGRLGRVEIKDTNSKINIEDFSFVQENQGQSLSARLSKIEGHHKDTTFKGSDIQYQAQDGKINARGFEFNQKDLSLKVEGAEFFYKEEGDRKQLNGEMDRLSADSSGYKVDFSVKDAQNIDQKLSVFISDDKTNKNIKIFNQDGHDITLDIKKDGQTYNALLKNIEYLSTNEFKQYIAEQIKINGTHKDINGQVVAKKVEFFETPVIRTGRLDGLEIKANQNSTKVDGKLSEIIFQQTSEQDSAALKRGEISLVDKDLKGNISFEEAFYTKLKDPTNDITLVRFDNTQLVAVKDSILSASLGINHGSLYRDKASFVVELNSIKDLNINELRSKINASGAVDRLVVIKTKDERGKDVQFFLMEGADIKFNSKDQPIIGQLSAKFLEVGRVDGRTFVSGDAKIDATYDGPIRLNTTAEFKGQNVTFDSVKHKTDKTVSAYYSIHSPTESGGIDHLKLTAGPDFLKDAISFEAKGNAGKSLDFTFVQDKSQGTYYVKAEFKEGDKIKVKLFPFTLESKKEGDTAKIELSLSSKGQNFMNHLDIISNVVSSHEITDFLEISSGGMIIAKSPTFKGFGMELMYQDEKVFDPGIIPPNGTNKTKTIGGGVFYRGDSGSETSIGMMLSGDSQFDYQTNGRGVLKVMGMKMPEQGSIPGTVNFYFKHKRPNGDQAYVGVFADTTSYTIDKNVLSPHSQYFEGGRRPGGTGFSAGYSKKIDENSKITIAGGLTNDFEDPALCITYEAHFGGRTQGSLARDVKDITDFLEEPVNPFGGRSTASMSGPTMENAKALYFDRLNYLDWEIARIESAKKLSGLFEKLLNNYDRETVREIRQWENRNLLNKQDEKLVKAAFGEITPANYQAQKANLEHWKERIKRKIDEEKYKNLVAEYETVKSRGW